MDVAGGTARESDIDVPRPILTSTRRVVVVPSQSGRGFVKSIFLFISLWASAGLAGAMPARWRTGYVPFSVPWVDSLARDSRIVAVADISFPSMVPVKFNPTSRDPGAVQETMWVRILDRDPETGVFLGDLMGRPERLLSVSQHDNVIFKFGAMMETLPSALLVGDSYLALGGRTSEFAMAFVDGVAANRAVIYGGLRDSIAAHDTPDRKLGEMVDPIYACPDSVRTRRKEPCNTMLFKR